MAMAAADDQLGGESEWVYRGCEKRRRKNSHGFTSKCASLVKEQRARVYLLSRCVTLLLCRHIHGDD